MAEPRAKWGCRGERSLLRAVSLQGFPRFNLRELPARAARREFNGPGTRRVFARPPARCQVVNAKARANLAVGDLVYVRSTPSQPKYEKNGETVYGYTFAVDTIRREVAKADLKPKEASDETPPKKSRKAR